MPRETVSIKELLEAGVHFGHQTNRWNPKMKPYIFTEKDNIYIVDLQQTQKQLQEAYRFVKEIAADNGVVLFVGTKKQAQEVVKEEAVRCGMPFVTTRWLGGTLTNYETLKKSIEKLTDIEKKEEAGELQTITKKEMARLMKEKQRLLRNLAGIKNMGKIPQALFIVDARHERTAISEAQKMNVPIVSLLDTNSDPDPIDYCIVGNDDALKSITIITTRIADAVLDGKKVTVEANAETAQGEKHEHEDNG